MDDLGAILDWHTRKQGLYIKTDEGVSALNGQVSDLVNEVGGVNHMVFRIANKRFEDQSQVLGQAVGG